MTTDTEARLAALEAEVRELRDIEAIRELRNRYHHCINEGFYDQIPLLFTEDGELDFSYIGKTAGREKLTKFFAATPKVLPFIKQFIHNHMITVDGDRAIAVSYMEARTINNDQAFIVAGCYDDVCVREGDEWKFKSMNFEAYYTLPYNESWLQDDRLKMARREKK